MDDKSKSQQNTFEINVYLFRYSIYSTNIWMPTLVPGIVLGTGDKSHYLHGAYILEWKRQIVSK